MHFNFQMRLCAAVEWNVRRTAAHALVAATVAVAACGYDSFDQIYTGAPSIIALMLSSPDAMTFGGRHAHRRRHTVGRVCNGHNYRSRRHHAPDRHGA